MASWREKLAAQAGMTLKQYLKTDAYKQAKKSREKDEKSQKDSNKGYEDIVKSILKATPAQQAVKPAFETTYGSDLQAEDFAQSEALYKPYFEQQISNELEDLNAWSEAENVSYDRSLRRARFSLAASGGAIGGERDTQEGEISADHTKNVQNTVRGVERTIGTDKIKNAGYQSTGQQQEGSLIGSMKSAIQEGQLWHKNQRAQRYYGDTKTYYAQPSSMSLAGNKM